MSAATLPRIHFSGRSNLCEQHWHSLLISALRGLAAVQVVAAHLRAQLYPSLKSLPDPALWYQLLSFLTGFAHQAVVLFFLLSGWLVGGSLLNKLGQPGIFLPYAIDRLSRMWIVLIPAFGLTLLLAVGAGTVDPTRIDFARSNEYSWSTFGGNLLGVQDMLVERYGGNFALWSLANEMWYYVLFPLLLVPLSAADPWTKALSLGTLLLAGLLLSLPILLFFAVWLMGVLASRIRIEAGAGWIAVMVLVFAIAAVLFRLFGSNDKLEEASFLQDVVFSVLALAILCSLQFPADLSRRGVRWIRAAANWLAAFSFTLYVIHVPLLLAIKRALAPLLEDGRLSLAQPAHFALYCAILVAIVMLSWLFHLPFEAQTGRLRRALRRTLLDGRRIRSRQNIA